MKKLMMAVVVAAGTASALAMPTKDELTKAQPLVAELMAPAMAKYKAAGYKEKAAAAAKVGDASSEFAKAAETEAAKFLLLKGAVNFYTRGEQYDKAADMIAELQREVKDVPPAVIAEITGKATGKISEAKAPKLYAIYRSAKLQVRAADEAKSLAAKLKKAKSDALQRKYAEALAVSGDWKAAYAEFAKVSDAKLKEIAAAEAAGNAKNAESGEFWWAYQPAFEDADDFFKSHAAAYYRKALDAGEITGLKKTIVEQRIKDVIVEVQTAAANDGLYCVIDLSGGPDATKYPVSYLNDVPKGGWTDEYKTSKLVLRRIEAGTFNMGKRGETKRVTISKPYYIGVFEVTQQQWALLMGSRPSMCKGEKYKLRPVENVKYDMIRGNDKGAQWPQSDEVDGDSFMGVLRTKTSLCFDLPTEAQWEYACRAGTTSDYANGMNYSGQVRDSAPNEMCRFFYHDGSNKRWKGWDDIDFGVEPSNGGSAIVGSYKPNAWGLYDMHGNVGEVCLDWFGSISGGIDPRGSASGEVRVNRGGSWLNGADMCTSYHRYEHSSFENKFVCASAGFRVLMVVGRATEIKHGGSGATADAKAKGMISQQKTYEYKGFLPTKETLLWENVSLNRINKIKGYSGGGACGRYYAVSSHMKGDSDRRTFQFQVMDGPTVKCIGIELTQQGKDVYGRAVYGRYIENGHLGEKDFDKDASNAFYVSDAAKTFGYGVQDLKVVFDEGSGMGDTVVTTETTADAEAKEDGVDEGREVTVVKTVEEGGAAWRYSFGVSNGNWAKSGFDDSGWQEGKGMFVDGGYLMKDERFTRVIRGQKTKWESEQIWLRQRFVLDGKSRQNISKVTLRYYVWGAAEFYLNGEKVATSAGGGDIGQIYSRGYVEIDITEQAKKLLKPGKGNVLAAHASNSSGGRSYWIRYIDAGLSITTK